MKAHIFESDNGGPRQMRSVIYARNCHHDAQHPTQKPVDLLVTLVRYSCPPGGLVLDPFCGSGSTGVAALLCGRRFVGIDISQEYVDIAKRRLAEETAQGSLLEAR